MGAESIIYKLNEDTLIKIREKKPYRLDIIDKKLRKSRTKKEFKILSRLYSNGVSVPEPIEIKINDNETSFTFRYIKSNNLKEVINKDLLFKAFEEIIKMHNIGIIHGDLTTLNMIVDKTNSILYLIDFGLGEISNKIEDRAVDLNLFFNSIKNEHPDLYTYKNDLLVMYETRVEFGSKIIERLRNIEKRGRNK